MRASLTVIRAAIAACAAIAPAVHAQTFEWVDPTGATRPADTVPPAEVAAALRVVEGEASLSALERRTLAIINQQASAERARLSSPDADGAPAHPARGEDAQMLGETAVGRAQSPATENVRDPCLLSWDPRCVEKHAADYHPRLGYAPSLLRKASAQAPQPAGGAQVPANVR